MEDETPDDGEQLPDDFEEVIKDFKSAVLKERPIDLVGFAVDYFTSLRESAQNCSVQHTILHVVPEDDDVGSASTTSAAPDRRRSSEEPVAGGGIGVLGPRYGRRGSICAESYDPSKDTNETFVVHPKTDPQRQRLTESVSGILLFRALDTDQMKHVVDAMFERKVSKGEVIIKQGDDGDNFYVIERGKFDCLVNKDGKTRSVLQLEDKGYFGELALMYNQPRAATVVALTDGQLWAMDRFSFRHIVLKSAFRKRQLYDQLLENVSTLKHLDAYERMTVADALVTRQYTRGNRIIREGDAADGMYFIEEGQVRVTIRKNQKEVEVSKMSEGKYFGEKALVDNSPRTASVYAVGNVKVAFLERESFERLLGPCLDLLKRQMKGYKKSS